MFGRRLRRGRERTGSSSTSTLELTWALLLAVSRHLCEEDWSIRQDARAVGAQRVEKRELFQRADFVSVHYKL